MNNPIDRRIFLKSFAAVFGGFCASCISRTTQGVSGPLGMTPEPVGSATTEAPVAGATHGVEPAATAAETKVYMPTVIKSATPPSGSIIADHTIVNRYTDIPQLYIDEVKKTWLNTPGESHAEGYVKGLRLLSDQDARFPVSIANTPEQLKSTALRVCTAKWGDYANATGWVLDSGEEDWYTNNLAIERTKNHLSYCHTQQLGLGAMGFAWCWDMSWENGPDGGIDPIFKVRWAGRSEYGPDGNWIWGLDAGDYVLTNNSVCMDTYLQATQEYINYCNQNSIATKVFFTTGPVDQECTNACNTGEAGYQRHIKHEYIRNYVRNSTDRFLFDYADILSWNDAGNLQSVSWIDHGGATRQYPIIHADNLDNPWGDPGGHIGEIGAIRLAKAMWWMLARMAGWSG